MAEGIAINVTRAASPTPVTYEVPGTVEVEPLSAFARFDGTGSTANFKPSLAFYSDAGILLARAFPTEQVVAGGSADVSYFPRVGGGAGNVGGGGTTLLFDYTVTAATKASIDTALDGGFAGPLRTDLTYLEVYLTGRTDEATFVSDVSLFYNNDTTAGNYTRTAIASSGAGNPIQVQLVAGQTSQSVIAGGNAAAGVAGLTRLFLPAYADSTFFKIGEFTGWSVDTVAGLTHYQIGLEAVVWENTSAVSRIMFTPFTAGANFVAGTRLSVWAR